LLEIDSGTESGESPVIRQARAEAGASSEWIRACHALEPLRWVDSTRGRVRPNGMKAWRDDARRRSAGAPDPATIDDLRRRGIDLDPTGHDEGGTEDPGHSHPHRHAETGDPPPLGIIAAGAV